MPEGLDRTGRPVASAITKTEYEAMEAQRMAYAEAHTPISIAPEPRTLYAVSAPVLNYYEWAPQGACREESGKIADVFQGSEDKSENLQMIARAKNICANCVVIEPCLEYALEKRLKGVAGGMSESERNRLRKARNAAAKALKAS